MIALDLVKHRYLSTDDALDALLVGNTYSDEEATIEARWHYFTLNTRLYLRERLDYDAILDAHFASFAEAWREDNPYDGDLGLINEWLLSIGATGPDGEAEPRGGNTYNFENHLDTVLDYVEFEYEDRPYVVLRAHLGGDVRGNYGEPIVFGCEWSFLLDSHDAELSCTRVREWADHPRLPGLDIPDVEHYLSLYGPDIVDSEGNCTDPWADNGVDMWHEDEETGEHMLRCPYCPEPTPMTVTMPYPPA